MMDWRSAGLKPKPTADFHARTPAADAKPGFRIDHTNLDAGCFDFWQIKRVHAVKIGILWVFGHPNAPLLKQKRLSSSDKARRLQL